MNSSSYTHPFGAKGEKLSIIIPTYNCAHYLEETLLSVKKQAGIEDAQILVVDDHSTKDNPKEVIDRVWPERVAFFRQPTNVGPCANFNACLDLADRDWIHMLHGDDFLFEGAYDEFAACLREVPDAIAAFARSIVIDEDGLWITCSWQLGDEWRGRLEYKPEMWANSPVPCPGVLISRRAVELVGKFDCSFCHAQDCNMWWRIARTGKAAYSNKCIAAYRESPGNHTSSLLRTGRNLEEDLNQTERVLATLQNGSRCSDEQITKLYKEPFEKALRQCITYLNDPEAFSANFRIFRRFPPQLRRHRRVRMVQLRHLRKSLERRLSRRAQTPA